MHVGDLDGSGQINGRRWTATVSVLVVDNNGSPVANATVEGNWSTGGRGNASCTTAGNGLCSISISGIRDDIPSVTFTVADVSHSSLSYDAGANSDPDGDSNGTSITINMP